MKPHVPLRRWPSVNFLAEVESPESADPALYDLALREPALRRAYRRVEVLGKTLQARIGGPDWARLADARGAFQTALFDLGFNVGFENGIIRTRAELVRQGHPTDAEKSLGDELRRIVAVSGLSAERATVAVLGIAYALADSPLATGRDG